jgi:hypothetical protein
VTREHIWPDWMSEELAAETTFSLASEGKPTRSWVGAGSSPTVRAVCSECNHGWMSGIEGTAKPTLIRLMNGQTTILEPSHQKGLAAWAAKTVTIIAQMNPGTISIQPAHLESLRDSQEAASSVRVFIAAADATHPADTFYRDTSIRLNRPAGDLEEPFHPEAYAATIAIRHVVFQVVGSAMETLQSKHSTPFNRFVRRIWPTSGAFTWPPGGRALNAQDLENFADHWKRPSGPRLLDRGWRQLS